MIEKAGFLQLDAIDISEGNLIPTLDGYLKSLSHALIILPERLNTPPFILKRDMDLEHAEPIPGGETVSYLTDIARQNHLYLVAGIIEKDKGKVFNTSILVGPDGIMGKHHKISAPETEISRYTYGNSVTFIRTEFATIALTICNDLLDPKVIAQLKSQPCDLVCHNSEYGGNQFPSELNAITAELQIPLISANKCGFPSREIQHIRFTGSSMIINRQGKTLYQANEQPTVHLSDWAQIQSND